MEDKLYRVYNSENEVVLETSSYAYLFFFAVAYDAFDRTPTDARRAANVAHELWLKDEGPTPMGELADYCAKNFRVLECHDSRSEMLQDFYMDYESEDYDIPDYLTCTKCGYKQSDHQTIIRYWESDRKDVYICGACLNQISDDIDIIFDELEEEEDLCPHGGDPTDCGNCIYGVDYGWDPDKQDCVKRKDDDDEEA